jgi:hypothetical protein
MISMERGEDIANAELEVGMELEIVGIKAAEPRYRIPAGFVCWDEVFANVGMPGMKHVPF